MTNKNIYNFFLFMSTLTRSLVEVFSVILLYDKGYSINNIFLFLLVMYLSGIVVNYLSLKINYKIVLIISILLYGGSYLYLSIMGNSIFNLIVFGIILSISSYSYHAIRHYLALNMVSYDKGKNINIILVVMYIATMISNLVGVVLIDKLSITGTSMVIIVLSFISIVPILKLDNIKNKKNRLRDVDIGFSKVMFSILEQFKVILMEIQPLYIYLYVKNSMYYVSIFNVIISLASLLFMLFLSKRVKNKYFRYFNLVLGGILIFKLNISNSIVLLFIAFLEGIGIKLYERFSLDNLYNKGDNEPNNYLIVEEMIFFSSKSFIMFVFYMLSLDIKVILYICIIGIVASGFYISN